MVVLYNINGGSIARSYANRRGTVYRTSITLSFIVRISPAVILASPVEIYMVFMIAHSYPRFKIDYQKLMAKDANKDSLPEGQFVLDRLVFARLFVQSKPGSMLALAGWESSIFYV